MNLDDMMRLGEDQARLVLLKTREELVPQWLYVNGEGKTIIVATPWENSDQKHMVVEIMRRAMKRDQASAYSLVVEAWFAHVTGEEATQKEYLGPPVRERADRRECVVIMAANRVGEHKHCHLEIVRDHQHRCRELKRLDGPEDQITSAIFDNLLADNRGRAN